MVYHQNQPKDTYAALERISKRDTDIDIAKFKSLLGAIVLVAFVTLIFVCMLRLIRDLDNPFEYNGPIDAEER